MTTSSYKQWSADVVVPCACELGEAPTWDAAAQRLIWVDIEGRALFQLDADGQWARTALDRTVTAVVPDTRGRLVAAADCMVTRLDGAAGWPEVIAALPTAGDGVTNDGRCDPSGRLWIGTVDRSGANRAGLFCVAPDGSVVQVRRGVGLSNGLDWSPDGTICHYVDSSARCIRNLHLDGRGLPVRSEVFVTFDATPDGVTVDSAGGIWVAVWDGGVVQRYTPDGRLDGVVEVPGGFVTSCAFGGADLATLFITTARSGLDGEQRRRLPHAGDLFAADVGVSGCGYAPFGGRR